MCVHKRFMCRAKSPCPSNRFTDKPSLRWLSFGGRRNVKRGAETRLRAKELPREDRYPPAGSGISHYVIAVDIRTPLRVATLCTQYVSFFPGCIHVSRNGARQKYTFCSLAYEPARRRDFWPRLTASGSWHQRCPPRRHAR